MVFLMGDKGRNIILCQRCFPFIGQMVNFSLSKYLLIWTAHARILKQILNVSMVARLNFSGSINYVGIRELKNHDEVYGEEVC